MNRLKIMFLLIFSTLVLRVEGQTALAETLRRHVFILASDSLSGRGFGFPEKKLAVDYIINQFGNAGFTAYNENFTEDFLHFEGQTLIEGKNILGIIEGSDPVLKREYIVLGAHYDHLGWKPLDDKRIVYNGADDNASGVASIIEIGRLLSERKGDIKRSIIIAAFDGEEAGLIGSSAFINGPGGDSLNIKAMFSLDMVGMFSQNKGVNLNGFNSLKDGKKLAIEIAQSQNIPVRETKENIEMWTDTWSFGKKNIPSFYVSTGLLSPYHKPEDDSDLLDYEGMGRIVNLISEIVFRMANKENELPDKRFITHSVDPKVMTGITVGIGTSQFNYNQMFYNAKPVLALQAGIISQLKLSKILFLRPAFNWEMTGSNTENGRIYFHSLSPEINLMFSTPAEDLGNQVLFCFSGGYYRYYLSETGKAEEFSSQYSKTDYGINIGAGKRNINTEITFCMKFGLKNTALKGPNDEIFSRSAFVAYTRYF